MSKRTHKSNGETPQRSPSVEKQILPHGDNSSDIEGNLAQQTELFDLSPPPWEIPDSQPTTIATVVFSEAPHGPYDYSVNGTDRYRLQAGMRVKVPLGKRRQPLIAWCTSVETKPNTGRSLRAITEIIDDSPLCDEPLVRLVLWMSHYYQAPAGQVFDTLIPSSVRALAGTREKIYYNPTEQAKNAEFNKTPPRTRRRTGDRISCLRAC